MAEWWDDMTVPRLADMVEELDKELAAANSEIERLKEAGFETDTKLDGTRKSLSAARAENERLTVELAGWKQAARQMEAERDDAQTDLGKVILALPTGTGERAAGPVEGVKTMRKRLEAERDEARAQVAILSDIADTIDSCFADNETGESRILIDGEWHSGPVAAECERIIKDILDLIRMRAGSPSAALEAYGREKVREGMKRASDLCKPKKIKMDWGDRWTPAGKNPQSAAAQSARKQCHDAILAEMEALK